MLLITWGLILFSLSWGWCQVIEGTPRQPPPSRPNPSLSTPAFEYHFQPPARKEPQAARVPSVLGQTQGQASGTLTRAGLRVGHVGRKTGNQPPGTVVQQNPDPGARVTPGSTVDLWLAERPPELKPSPPRVGAPSTPGAPPPIARVRVPYLITETQPQASHTLAGVRLRLGKVARMTSDQTPGTVVRQDPPAGTPVSSGSAVHLWLAERPKVNLVTVPEVRGQNLSPAQKQLLKAGRDICDNVGLRVGKVARVTSNQTPETVVRQVPGAGSKVPCGTAVNLWLAETPKVDLVKVPDVMRQYRDPASSTLASARLRVGQVARITSKQTPGTVVDQDPKPDRWVHPGASVDLWLAAAPTPSPYPPVSPEPAPPSPSPPIPTPPSTPTPPVTRPPPTVTHVPTPTPPTSPALTKVRVPNLVGKNRERAREMLADTGLHVGEVVTRKAALKSGTIIEHTPEAEAMVPPDTRVTLVISSHEAGVTEEETDRSWWIILAGLLAVLGGGYYGVKRLIRRWILRAVQVRPETDMGTQHFVLDAPLHLDLTVRLKPVMDQGQQDLQAAGPLVLEEGEKP